MTTHRRAFSAALLIPLVLLLSSCVRLTMDIKVVDDKTADVTMNIGAKKDMASGVGLTGEKLCQQDQQTGINKDNTKSEPYDDGTYVGCKVSGKGAIDSSNTMLKLADGVWTFHLPDPNEADPQGKAQMTAPMFTDFKVSVTFPGEVLTHNGSSTVSGTTVTWTNPADLLVPGGLSATAKNTAKSGPLLWAILGAVALLVIGVVVFFVLRSRTKSSAAPVAARAIQPGAYSPTAPTPGTQPLSQAVPPTRGYPPVPPAESAPAGTPPQG